MILQVFQTQVWWHYAAALWWTMLQHPNLCGGFQGQTAVLKVSSPSDCRVADEWRFVHYRTVTLSFPLSRPLRLSLPHLALSPSLMEIDESSSVRYRLRCLHTAELRVSSDLEREGGGVDRALFCTALSVCSLHWATWSVCVVSIGIIQIFPPLCSFQIHFGLQYTVCFLHRAYALWILGRISIAFSNFSRPFASFS